MQAQSNIHQTAGKFKPGNPAKGYRRGRGEVIQSPETTAERYLVQLKNLYWRAVAMGNDRVACALAALIDRRGG